ncbi:MAG: RNA polymerase sigma factor [Candidatus Nanoarchaeia archaeon]
MVLEFSESDKKNSKDLKFKDCHEYGYVLKDFTNGRKFYSMCKGFSKRHGITFQDFEDVYQDFLIYSELRSNYNNNKGSEKNYFFTNFRNKLLDFLRKRSREKSRNFTEFDKEQKDMDYFLESNGFYESETPQTEYIRKEAKGIAKEIVDSNMEKLKKTCNYAPLTDFLLNLSYKEISKQENICMGTVRSRLLNGKNKLRKMIKEENRIDIEDILEAI